MSINKLNTLEEMFSKYLIKLIPDIHQAVTTDFIKNKSRNIHEVPSLSCWLECYRRSKFIFNFSILNILESSDNASVFKEQFAITLIQKKQKKQFIENTIKEVRSFSDEEKAKFDSEVAEHVEQLKKESDILFSETYNDVSQDEARSFISRHDIQFFQRIIIPCLALYGKFPSQILRNARLGNEKSIRKLAQIDYSIVQDKKISRYIHNISFRNPTQHKLLIRALVRDHPKPKLKDFKIDAAALLAMINTLFSKANKTKKMTVPQLRQIFVDDAKSRGLTDDQELPTGETLYKSIKRNTLWEDLFKLPDKN